MKNIDIDAFMHITFFVGTVVCRFSEFDCGVDGCKESSNCRGTCIPGEWVKNGSEECANGSDESVYMPGIKDYFYLKAAISEENWVLRLFLRHFSIFCFRTQSLSQSAPTILKNQALCFLKNGAPCFLQKAG